MLAQHATRFPLEDPGQRHMGGFRKCRHILSDAAHQAIDRRRHAITGTATFPPRHRHERKWRRSDSNRRPPACKAGALPLSYAPAGEDANSSTRTGQRQRSRITTPSLRGNQTSRTAGNLVGQGGLEPPTPRLSSVCSNPLSYWPRTCGVAQVQGKDARSALAAAKAATRHAGMAGMSADNQEFR